MPPLDGSAVDRLRRGRLKAVVAKAFPLSRAADAHVFLQDRENVGKVVLTV